MTSIVLCSDAARKYLCSC